jgi:hypothetical protein
MEFGIWHLAFVWRSTFSLNSKLQTPNSKLQTPNSKLPASKAKLDLFAACFWILGHLVKAREDGGEFEIDHAETSVGLAVSDVTHLRIIMANPEAFEFGEKLL